MALSKRCQRRLTAKDIVDADRAVGVKVSGAVGVPKFPKHHQHIAYTHGTVSRQVRGTVAA